MDPDATLTDLREQVADILSDNHHNDITIRLAERFEALDEWMSKGSFAPRDWAHRECDLCPHAVDHDHREGR